MPALPAHPRASPAMPLLITTMPRHYRSGLRFPSPLLDPSSLCQGISPHRHAAASLRDPMPPPRPSPLRRASAVPRVP